MKYILPIIWICACLHKSDDGRTYRLMGVCEQGHFESDYSRKFESFIGRWVCDSVKIDTIWTKSNEHLVR